MPPGRVATFAYFLKEIWKHGVNGYSAASLVLALLAVLPIWPTAWPGYFGILSLCAVAYYAAFAAWRQAVASLPNHAYLSIQATSAQFAASFDSLLPASPARFDIRLDVTNPASEPLDLVTVEVVASEFKTSLLGGTAVAKLFGRPENHWGQLTSPTRIEPHERRRDLAVFVELAFVAQGPEDFARRLGSSTTWAITIRLTAENSARVSSTSDLKVSGDFSETKAIALARWKRERSADLVAALAGLS